MPVEIQPSPTVFYTPSAQASQKARYANLATEFQHKFNSETQYVLRAPGRVNLMGDHVDYCLFSVLPSAIPQDTLMAVSLFFNDKPGKTALEISSIDKEYTSVEYTLDLNESLDQQIKLEGNRHWSWFILAGLSGLFASLSQSSRSVNIGFPSRVQVLVTGSIPVGSGLSSSAALTVVSVVLGALIYDSSKNKPNGPRLNEIHLDRMDITKIAIKSERLVGVNSGGMDQAASILSQPSSVLHIEFYPELCATPITLPAQNLSWVITNSQVQSVKADTSKYRYNLRVAETRLAALVIAQKKGLDLRDIDFTKISLAGILWGDADPREKDTKDRMESIRAFLSDAQDAIKKQGGYTWNELVDLLGFTQEELERVCEKREVEPIEGKFQLWKRTRHVLTEAIRVYEFCEALRERRENLAGRLCEIIAASQNSLTNDCEVSVPEIEQIISLGQSLSRVRGGIYAGRVTGAGWGGSIISLISSEMVTEFIDNVKEQYYKPRGIEGDENSIFEIRVEDMGSGAGLVKL